MGHVVQPGKQVDVTAFVAIACNALQKMKVDANGDSAPVPAVLVLLAESSCCFVLFVALLMGSTFTSTCLVLFLGVCWICLV